MLDSFTYKGANSYAKIRSRLVHRLKHIFSIFKYHYMYFTFFFIHTYIHTYFQFLSACTKHPLRLQNFCPSSLTHESVGMIGWWRCLMLMYWIYIISLIMCKSYTIVHCKRENTCIRCILNIYFRHMLTIII